MQLGTSILSSYFVTGLWAGCMWLRTHGRFNVLPLSCSDALVLRQFSREVVWARRSPRAVPCGRVITLSSPSEAILCFNVDLFFPLFYFFIYRGKGGWREGEEHQSVVASRAPLLGTWPATPGMCPAWESGQRPFGSKADAQSTEPHQADLSVP